MGQYLKMNLVVPEQYIEGFTRANNTFLYQLVFDPIKRKVVPLNAYPEHINPATLGYAGLYPPALNHTDEVPYLNNEKVIFDLWGVVRSSPLLYTTLAVFNP